MENCILFIKEYPRGLKRAWEKYGFTVLILDATLIMQGGKTLQDILKAFIEQRCLRYVFSFDYEPLWGEMCHSLGLKYLCWILDCPHTSLWSKTSKYIGNYFFVFDYNQYLLLRDRDLKHLFYLPLCTDTEAFAEVIEKDAGMSKKKFGADVSFLGNLYNDKNHNLYDQIVDLPPYVQGYFQVLMEVQKKIWGNDLLYGTISDRVWDLLDRCLKWDLGDKYDDSAKRIQMINILGQKLTQMERMEACSCLAKYFDFSLYTDSDTSFDAGIRNLGHADYLSQMPLIFHYSKINIHITMRSIPSGISLRVLDVLACGGFLLTNYQPEIAEYFEDGMELVMYYNFEDMYEKIRYYLEHGEERRRIARAGQEKVSRDFNYLHGVGIILERLTE